MAIKAATKKYMDSIEYAEIRRDLIGQLNRNGTEGSHFTNLVDDYMDLWVTKCLLVDDIRERGVNVAYDNGGGQKGRKKNDSVELRIKVNAQMLKLLSDIGIKATQGGGSIDPL